ncbi:Bifunctional inhibitor/lipid-transfer protein/seed storage 2S albumin superfamily protein [Euphorbia peplus]|nr:Bifunctional inhibitor/lipid-transfer protein/seed storage 2S albumin superfamily protein [Euphorbia peplus]
MGESRGQDTSCINQLVPCLNYLNGTKDVPDSCCDPLENIVKSNPQCLCSMISNQASTAAEMAGINISHAQMLPARCGLRVNPLSCLTTGSPNSKDSVDNSSGELLILSSWTVIIATAFSLLHILLFCNTD